MNRNFVALDGLRGIAALAVVVFHFPELFAPLSLPGSYLAVDLFFVLSGFVLAHAYEGRLRDGLGTLNFMAIRAIRLYPLYLTGALAMAAILTVTHYLGVAEPWPFNMIPVLGFSLGGLPTPQALSGSVQLYPGNFPVWSLFFEFVINVAFALTARHLTSGRLTTIVVVAGAALLALAFDRGSMDMGVHWDTFWGGLARVAFAFPLGVLIYRAWRRGGSIRLPYPLAAILVALVFWAPVSGTARLALDLGAVFFLFPLLIFSAAGAPTQGLTLISSKLGVASYGVYVLHVPTITALFFLWPKLLPVSLEALAPYSGLGVLALVLAVSLVVDKVYDAPVRAWLTARYAALKAGQAAPAQSGALR